MEVDKVILTTKNKTSDEINDDMIGMFEKNFNTGPIIGEARECLSHAVNNLYIRDLCLEALGFDEVKREEMFRATTAMIDERNANILALRENEK